MTFSIHSGVRNTLHWEDYLVFAIALLIPACIGLYHALKARKGATTRDFLVGNRKMHTVPVALSVSVTFLSALTLLGMPAEVYSYDTMFWWLALGMVLAVAGAAHIFIPVLYKLGILSAYQYFEMRFGNSVRIIASLNWIIQTMMYQSFVLFAPSLALNAVTGLDLWLSVSTVGIIVTIYTTLGGMKTVLWTDSIQTVIILVGLLSLLVMGSQTVGGFGRAWEFAGERKRLRFFDFNPSPGVRHSFWTVVIGGGVMWVSQLGVNQTQVQRLLSCPSLRKAQIALWLSAVCLVVIVTMCSMLGVLIHALYADCDPQKFNGLVSSADQLVPLFAMDIFHETRFLPGVFLACIFSGSLSSLSSALNALSAVILEDYIMVYCCANITDLRAAIISKLIVLVCGALSILVAFIISRVGNILQVSYSLLSVMDGPLLGLFVLGMFCPIANHVGAVVGYFVSFIFMLWVGLGTYLYGASPPLSHTTIDLCTRNTTNYNNTTAVYNNATIDTSPTPTDDATPNYLSLYDLSYLYYTTTGMAITYVVGALVSYLMGFFKKNIPAPPQLSRSPVDILLNVFSKKEFSHDVVSEEEVKLQHVPPGPKLAL